MWFGGRHRKPGFTGDKLRSLPYSFYWPRMLAPLQDPWQPRLRVLYQRRSRLVFADCRDRSGPQIWEELL